MKNIILILFLVFAASLSAIDVSGTQSGTWSSENSPYNLVGDIIVQAGETLEIETGVEIISNGYYEILVNGAILAIGTESEQIIFQGLDNVDWAGIRLDTDGSDHESSFEYCTITDTHDLNDSGIHSINSRVTINYCTFSNHEEAINLSGLATNNPVAMSVTNSIISDCTQSGIIVVDQSNLIIDNNEITQCGLGEDFRGAIQLSLQSDAHSCSPTISNNWIHHNGKQGLTLANLFSHPDMEPTVLNNTIEYNLTGIYLYAGEGVYRNNIIRHNFIENDANSGAGVMLYGANANAIFTDNQVYGNYCGFYLANSATVNLGNLDNASIEDDGQNLIYNNVFFNGTPYNINNVGSTDIMAQNNVWDSDDTTDIETRLVTNGTINYQPFLTILAPVDITLDSEELLQFSIEQTYATHTSLLGYNLYLNDELLEENFNGDTYQFEEMPELPFTFSVSAVYEEGESEIADYYIEATVANPPQNLTYAILESSVELSWDAPEAGSSADLDNYNIYFSGETIETAMESGELFNLEEGQTYTVGLSAIYQNGVESEVVEIEFTYEHSSADEDLSLNQINLHNYPNPFVISAQQRNNATTISFNLPKDFNTAEIEIFNVKGQAIKKFDIQKGLESQTISWDGTDHQDKQVSSGIYLYQLKIDQDIRAQKTCAVIK